MLKEECVAACMVTDMTKQTRRVNPSKGMDLVAVTSGHKLLES